MCIPIPYWNTSNNRDRKRPMAKSALQNKWTQKRQIQFRNSGKREEKETTHRLSGVKRTNKRNNWRLRCATRFHSIFSNGDECRRMKKILYVFKRKLSIKQNIIEYTRTIKRTDIDLCVSFYSNLFMLEQICGEILWIKQKNKIVKKRLR